jgi:S1-C subfamily serine protease
MRFLLALFLFTTSLLAAPSAYPRFDVPVEVPAVVSVGGWCTGFVAAPNVIFTAAHCVRDQKEDPFLTVTFWRGDKRVFFVAGYGEETDRDFAILFGDTMGVEPMKLRTSGELPAHGDLCTSIGYGGGSKLQQAVPCTFDFKEPGTGFLIVNASVIPGDSGGPIIDLQTGEVFGIVVRTSYPFPQGFIAPIGGAEQALAVLKRAKHVAPPRPSRTKR